MTQTQPTNSPTPQRTSVLLPALFVLVAAFFVGAVTAEEKVIVDEKYKLAFDVDGEVEVLHIEDLDEGESRQFFTDSGKEIVVTRTEDGLDVTIDGEPLEMDDEIVHKEVIVHRIGGDGGEIDIDMDGKHRVMHLSSGSPGAKVIVKKGDASSYAWSTAHGEKIDLEGLEHFSFHTSSAADFLQEKGVLDDLDADQRQAILDALAEYHGPMAGHDLKVMVVKDDEEDE